MVEAFAAFAHPADLSGGHACHQGIGFYVLGHHGTCCDKGTLAHRVAAHHGAVGAQRSAFAYAGLGIHAMHGEMSTRGGHVGEHTARPAEHIILNLNTFVDGDIVLHTDIIADVDIVAHIHILSEGAVLADDGTFLDVAEMPDLGSFADAHIVVDIAAFVYVVVVHLFFILVVGPSTGSGTSVTPTPRPTHQQYESP